MKLKKINYGSAVFFGAIALVMYLLLAVLSWNIDKEYILAEGITPLMLFVYTPVVGAIVAYLMVSLAILIYNFVAKKFPISWEVKK